MKDRELAIELRRGIEKVRSINLKIIAENHMWVHWMWLDSYNRSGIEWKKEEERN